MAYDRYLRKFSRFAATLGVKDPKDISLQIVNKYRLYLNRLKNEAGSLKIGHSKLPPHCPAGVFKVFKQEGYCILGRGKN